MRAARSFDTTKDTTVTKKTTTKKAKHAKRRPKKKAAQRDVADASRRIGPIIRKLTRRYPEATTALEHANPLQLLVATILSAQCTDARVNMVTKDLFAKYRTAQDYANADPVAFEQEIKSTGFFRQKTKSILGMAQALEERHGGEVPTTMDELTALPGVGRKTANVVLGNAFGIDVGVVVDTHVRRISNRLGLTAHRDPEKIERDLMEVVPQRDWTPFAHLLIHHGRQICTARSPKCEICPIAPECPSAPSGTAARR
ncbi:MAG: endonuclease III [Gemmatimonadota bacterium]|nr:MAG: endonuclease III [Gemmatimonadota bacterium]